MLSLTICHCHVKNQSSVDQGGWVPQHIIEAIRAKAESRNFKENQLLAYCFCTQERKQLVIASSTNVSFRPFVLLSSPPLSSPPFLLSCLSPSILQYVPPDLCICSFVLEQALSVRALQEMLANTGQNNEGVSTSFLLTDSPPLSVSLAHKHTQHLHTQTHTCTLTYTNQSVV